MRELMFPPAEQSRIFQAGEAWEIEICGGSKACQKEAPSATLAPRQRLPAMPAPLERLKSVWSEPVIHRQEVDLRLIPAFFITVIVIGALLLWSPWSLQAGQSIHPLDAVFLATSATCVTGLSSVNIAEVFTPFGHGVLLSLIQIGGLGIFTASISLVLMSGHKLSLSDEHTIRATLGRLQKVRPLDVFLYGCIFVFVLELAGA